MNFDWIMPTNPTGAFLIGVVFTLGFVFTTWNDTKSKKMAIGTFVSGVLTSGLLVALLNYYDFFK